MYSILRTSHYVVASAYDYRASAHGERKLLWRSKMTVMSADVAMADTLPTLIHNGGIYLGRDMPESATISRPVNRSGHTTLAPLEVKAYLDGSGGSAEKPTSPPHAESKP